MVIGFFLMVECYIVGEVIVLWFMMFEVFEMYVFFVFMCEWLVEVVVVEVSV